ncbi:MAG: hypothetical protein U5R06_02990 [candidate division KSB1 bacterium]|nr:hypothetical protein [candidate division KSB1 bacterium]
MRRGYRKILRHQFAKRMKETAPDFKPARVESIYLSPGERAYCWTVNEQADIPISSGSELAFDSENNLWIGTGSGVYVIYQ